MPVGPVSGSIPTSLLPDCFFFFARNFYLFYCFFFLKIKYKVNALCILMVRVRTYKERKYVIGYLLTGMCRSDLRGRGSGWMVYRNTVCAKWEISTPPHCQDTIPHAHTQCWSLRWIMLHHHLLLLLTSHIMDHIHMYACKYSLSCRYP